MVASVQPQSPQTLYEQSFRHRLQAILPETADWLQALRLRALTRFEQLGLPNRRLEAWKFINLRPLINQSFQPHTTDLTVTEAQLQPHLLGSDTIRLVFVNGRFVESLSVVPALPEGVWVGSLKTALQTQPERVQASLAKGLDHEPDALVVLNTALFEDGVFIDVPENVQLASLIHIVSVTTASAEPRAAYTRNVINLAPHARVQLAMAHVGTGETLYLNNSVQEFHLAEGVQAECCLILNEASQGWHLTATRNTLAQNAELKLSTVTLGGHTARHSITTLLQGTQAKVHLNGLDVLKAHTAVFHPTSTEHWVPDCDSEQYYKGILDDAGQSEFNGMVFVAEGANGTNSQQLNKNLLLSDNAKVWTRPQLKINADDVKCAHGATVGQLAEEQLFYLASRGLSRDLATALLTYGFAEEIVQRLSHPALRQYLDRLVLDNLQRSDAGLQRQLGV